MGAYRRTNGARQCDAVELERRKRACQRRDVIARPERRIEHDDRLTAKEAKPAERSTFGEPFGKRTIENVVTHGDPEPRGQRFECGDELPGFHTEVVAPPVVASRRAVRSTRAVLRIALGRASSSR